MNSADESVPSLAIDQDTMAQARRRPEPPLRRWAAARALRNDPGRLDDLLATTSAFPPLHRDAALHGLLDSAHALDEDDRRRLVRRGLRCGVGRIRRSALDRFCELDGLNAALRCARADADRTVRPWRPATAASPAEAELPDAARSA